MPDFEIARGLDGLIIFGLLGVLFLMERKLGLPKIWKWSVWCVLLGILSIAAQRATFKYAVAEGAMAIGIGVVYLVIGFSGIQQMIKNKKANKSSEPT